MKKRHLKSNFIKGISLALAAILIIIASAEFWKQDTLVVSAAEDSLPGIVQMRQEILSSGETYEILEIVPDMAGAEIGFYIGGEEPYNALYKEDTREYTPWGNQLAAMVQSGSSETVRNDFMTDMKTEADAILGSMKGTGETPFRFDNAYTEVPAGTGGARSVITSAASVKGYMVYEGEGVATAPWKAVFKKLTNTDIPLSTVNSGVGQAYYAVTEQAEYTYEGLKNLAEGTDAAGHMPLYEIVDGAFQNAGTAKSIWDKILVGSTVSGNDLVPIRDVSGNDVSGGNPSGEDDGENVPLVSGSRYYRVSFRLITPDSPVAAGTTVYLLDTINTDYVESYGNYQLISTEGTDIACDNMTQPQQEIWFTGGPDNTEVFKKQVLGLSDEECQKFRINVTTVTPEMLNDLDRQSKLDSFLAEMDMVYIQSGESGGVTVDYAADTNDITYSVMEKLGLLIYQEQKACLFDLNDLLTKDSGGYRADTSDGTNMARLAYFLLSSQKSSLITEAGGTTVMQQSMKTVKLSDYLAAYKSELENKDTDGDLGFVIENVWFFTNDCSVNGDRPFLRRGNLSDMDYAVHNGDSTTVGDDYEEVLSEIHYENLYRSSDASYTGALLEEKIYDKTIWRYVVNYSRRRAAAIKETLTVLDIEPASSTASVTREIISTWTGVSERNITLITVPMNQFVGMIDDLNAVYDMIYIGASTDCLNTDNGNTVYNDSGMNGLLYSHVGDAIKVNPALSGLLDTDFTGNVRTSPTVKTSTIQRFSGNDLTLEKYNSLMDYLGAYYPVVIDSRLLNSGKINEERVDNSSYLYEFLNEVYVTSPRKNVFSSNDLPSSTYVAKNAMFEFYANKPKLTLQATSESYPDLIMTTSKYYTGNTVNHNVTQINKSGDSFYLEFAFRIQDSGAVSFDQSYTCKLFLDANADGKFSETNEELSGITITAGGETVNSTNLKAGVDYIARREVPSTYSGCITWQLQVTQSNNADVRVVKKGYTKLNNPLITEEDRTIKILQVYFADSGKVINLQESIGTLENGNYVQRDGADGDGTVRITNKFKDNADKVKGDYLLDITTIRESQFAAGKIGETPINMDDYDMLILGFSDAKKDADWSAQSIEKITDFIESGKSVLFAHDMTSFTNIENYKSIYKEGASSGSGYMGNLWGWGYRINTYVRDLVGLDTYGITGRNLNNGSPYSILGTGRGLTRNAEGKLVNESGSTIPEPIKENGMYLYNTLDAGGNLLALKDVAYAPKSNRTVTVPEVQGYSAYILARTSIYDNDVYKYGYRKDLKTGEHAAGKNVQKINDGQITNFPFVIGDNVVTASTHNQYYTLDLNGDSDNDGQTDAVVWFNLTGGYFDKAPGDVKNNYYIYNKGNVTYTGMGHAANSDYANAVTEAEAQLFLNTMIAAYQAGKRTPDVITMDSSGLSTDIIYNYYDPMLTDVNVSESSTVKVYFSVKDLNMTQGTKTVNIKYYVEDEKNGSENLKDEDGKLINSSIKLRDVTGELAAHTYTEAGTPVADKDTGITRLDTENIYYVEVPVSYFNTADNGYDSEFYIYAQTTMVKKTAGDTVTSVTPWGYQSVRYVNCELFDLD